MTGDMEEAESSSSLSAFDKEFETTQKNKRRLGYVKPRSQPFSDSAQKRESVMSLGRIDHLQHRFAKNSCSPRLDQRSKGNDGSLKTQGSVTKNHRITDTKLTVLDEDDQSGYEFDPVTVPLPPSPTQKSYYRSVSDDVDFVKLRKKLIDEIYRLAQLMVVHEGQDGKSEISKTDFLSLADQVSDCVRSARAYSARIPTYKSISSSYSVFREDALEVRMILDGVVERSDSHAFSLDEISFIKKWLESLTQYLTKKEEETFDMKSVHWLDDSMWTDREDERHQSFLQFYSPILKSLAFDDQHILPITKMTTGVILCSIFNAVVLRSRKPFGLITRYHNDVGIRYRVLENLRYWTTALNYRFGIICDPFDVNEVFAKTDTGLDQLRTAIRLFCRAAIQEMIHTVAATESSQDITELLDVEKLQIRSKTNAKHFDETSGHMSVSTVIS